jgi:hypothetical protein
MFSRVSIIAVLAIAFAGHCFGNAAMPGVWQGGATARFVPLFSSDSAALQHVSMQREQILVDLYPGYAVVKGTYWMRNNSGKPIDMLVGYPLQGKVNAPVVSNIVLGFPEVFKVLVNGVATPTANNENELQLIASPQQQQANMQVDAKDWIVWRTQFAADTLTTLTVYFVVNCSQAKLRKGYSVKEGHAFAYVLESGRAWAGSIDTGNIWMRLRGGLKQKHINGLLPANAWQGSDSLMAWNFNNLEPSENNNLLVWYNAGKDSIDFNALVLGNTASLYAQMDAFPLGAFARSASWPKVVKSDIDPGTSAIAWIIGGGLALVVLVPASIVGIIIWVFVRRRKRRQSTSATT